MMLAILGTTFKNHGMVFKCWQRPESFDWDVWDGPDACVVESYSTGSPINNLTKNVRLFLF